MAKVTIELEDKPNGNVKVTVTPTMEQLVLKVQSGHELTSAEAYAFQAANAVRKEAKKQQGDIKVFIPRLK